MYPGLKLALTLAVAGTVLAQQPMPVVGTPVATPRKPAPTNSDPFQSLVVAGKDVSPAVRKLLKLNWHSRLSAALASARKSGRPVLWCQVLGDLRGLT